MRFENKYRWNLSLIEVRRKQEFESRYLKRTVYFDVVLPPGYSSDRSYPLLFLNDGQDFEQLLVESSLKNLWKNEDLHFIYVGIHTNERRHFEYGVSGHADFKGRGYLAKAYSNFVVKEFFPFINHLFSISALPEDRVFCGFSLGGLSALDIVWENPQLFGKVGVFSGSFWWRSRELGQKFDEERDRIIHNKVKREKRKGDLQFWFQCGTLDEKMDRNNNGIIDSIDDTLDFIKVLEDKGYERGQHINYVEVYGGRHDFNTWKRLWPKFLLWAFRR